MKDLEAGCSSEAGRGCRSKRKWSEPICCPICSVTLRVSEVQSHLTLEVDRLSKFGMTKTKPNGRNAPSSSSDNPDKSWETFQKTRLNRQNRHRSKTKKRKSDEICCPICNKESTEVFALHVDKCLRKSEGCSESDESIDVEAFEEYEWAGQNRVRVTSMLPVVNLGTSLSMTEEDEDLDVDGDDAQTFGSSQYSERDVILLPDDSENMALRKAVVGEEIPKRMKLEENESEAKTKGHPVIEVLTNKIRELENKEKNQAEIYKCLICMERYRTPVISVCCWHVHCEECWLQTLGAKKLCPQCNMITSPGDLRKIYM